MKLAWPESQKRVSCRCGSIDSVGAGPGSASAGAVAGEFSCDAGVGVAETLAVADCCEKASEWASEKAMIAKAQTSISPPRCFLIHMVNETIP
jgi:hypothetical protein